jgi:hypothetical protein
MSLENNLVGVIVGLDVELVTPCQFEAAVMLSNLVGGPTCQSRPNLAEQIQWLNIDLDQDSAHPSSPDWRLTLDA